MTKPLIQAILLTGIVVVLFVITELLPAIGVGAGFLSLILIILAVLRYGLRYALSITLSAALVLTIILRSSLISTLVSIGLFGLLLGLLIRERILPERIVLIGGIALLLIFGLEIIVYPRILGHSPPALLSVDNLTTYLKRIEEEVFSHIESQKGVSLRDIDKAKESYALFILKFPMLVPAMLILGAFIYAYLCYEVTRSILNRMGYQLTKFLPLSTRKAPDIFVWGFILSWMAVLVGEWQGIRSLYVVGLNVRYIFEFVYAIIGLGIAGFFLNKYNVPRVARFLAYIILIFGLKIVMFVGVFDTWFDFRKLKAVKDTAQI